MHQFSVSFGCPDFIKDSIEHLWHIHLCYIFIHIFYNCTDKQRYIVLFWFFSNPLCAMVYGNLNLFQGLAFCLWHDLHNEKNGHGANKGEEEECPCKLDKHELCNIPT